MSWSYSDVSEEYADSSEEISDDSEHPPSEDSERQPSEDSERQPAEDPEQQPSPLPVYLTAQDNGGVEAVAVGDAVRIFDTKIESPPQLTEIMELRFHGYEHIRSLDFSPNGLKLVGMLWHSLQIWNVSTGKPIGNPMVAFTGTLHCATLSPDGEFVACVLSADWGCKSKCLIWSTTTQKITKEMKLCHDISSIAWIPDSTLLAMAECDTNTIVLFSTSNWERIAILAGHKHDITCLAFFPDSQTLCSCSCDGLRQWCMQTKQEKGEPRDAHDGWIRCIAISNDGSMIATGGDDDHIAVWNVSSRQLKFPQLNSHTHVVNSVVFSRDNKILISCGAYSPIRFWDTYNGTALGQRAITYNPPYGLPSMAISPNGKIVATDIGPGKITLWHFSQSRQVAQFQLSSYPKTLRWERDGLHVDGDETPVYQRAWHFRQFVFHIQLLSRRKVMDAFSIWNVMALTAKFIPAPQLQVGATRRDREE